MADEFLNSMQFGGNRADFQRHTAGGEKPKDGELPAHRTNFLLLTQIRNISLSDTDKYVRNRFHSKSSDSVCTGISHRMPGTCSAFSELWEASM